MREIKFRGKCAGGWIYGYLVKHDNGEYMGSSVDIFTGETGWGFEPSFKFKRYSVDPETVGQYTDLEDNNNVKIFEGDILKHDSVDWGEGNDLPYQISVVYWDGGEFRCRFQQNDLASLSSIIYTSEVEVIGNIHDNPELLDKP